MQHLGQLTIPNGASRNNTTTAAPFLVSAARVAIRVRGNAANLSYETRRDNATLAAPSTFATTAATGYPLASGVPDREILLATIGNLVVAVYNNGGAPATLDVWDEG